ncbi:MAG: hypothetical protein GY749_42805, partial [Desulfobacteraceae bacterium]|nr:hypothetical protein [Desulfobacteraceae bacterium]
ATTLVWVTDTDLELSNIDLSGVSVDNKTLKLTGTVAVSVFNSGTTAAEEGYDVTLFEDTDNDGFYSASGDNIIGITTVSEEHAGGALLTPEISVNSSVLFSGNRIFAFADSKNSVDETDENNNIKHNMADCEFIPPAAGEFNPVPELEWPKDNPPVTVPGSYKVSCTPAVASLNDDNLDGTVDANDIPDIIFNSHGSTYLKNGILRAVSGSDGKEIFAAHDDTGLVYTAPLTHPAAGDIDGDGLVEILAVETGHASLAAFENDGSLKWRSSIPGSNYYTIGASITLSDIDEDGTPEIIIGNVVLNSDGTHRWTGESSLPGEVKGFACVANLDLEGYPEIIVGNRAYRADGETYWENKDDDIYWYTAVANFDDDSYPEVVGVSNGWITLMEHDGTPIWKKYFDGSYAGAPAIADVDNDGRPEIAIAFSNPGNTSWNGSYRVIDSDGSPLYWGKDDSGEDKWGEYISERWTQTGSSVFDFDGDGRVEVVFADEQYLRIFRANDEGIMETVFKYPMGSHTGGEYPVIADVDNDNNAEIIVIANRIANVGIRVFGDANDTWLNTRKIWNQHAYHITNVNDDGTIPRTAGNNWETFNSFRQNQIPNAFGCIDLTGSRVRADKSGYPDSVKITARFGNGGALHIAPGAAMSFYDGDPKAGGTLLGTVVTTRQLNPGEYEDLSLTLDSPQVGILTVYAVADDDGTGTGGISETDEENNT